MDKRKELSRLELRVGIVTGLALLLLAIVIFSVGKIRLGQSGYPLDITFSFVDAINPQADVMIGGGVKIGHVEAISIQGEYIQVRVSINHGVKIPVGSKFQVLSKGLMGDKYLNVIPLTTSAAAIPPGSRVAGVEPANMDRAFQRLGMVADSVQGLVGDPEMKSLLLDTLRSFSNLSRRLDRVVADNEGRVDQSVRDFASAAREINRFTADLDPFSRDLKELLSEENRGNLRATLNHLQEVSARLEAASAQIGRGEGALGVLIEDKQMGEDLKALVRDVRSHPWKLLWKE